MSGGVQHLVQAGPLILAAPIAAAACALTFLSPCVLPLVPGYLSYVTGMSGTDAQRAQAATAERVAVTPDGTSLPVGARASGDFGLRGTGPGPPGTPAPPSRTTSAAQRSHPGPDSTRHRALRGGLFRSCSPPRAWPSAAWGWCCNATRPG